MEIETVCWLIKNRLQPGKPEGETARVWNTILTSYYPAALGFSTGPEMPIGSGRADLFTAHLVIATIAKEYKFLIVECKAPRLETQGGVWTEAITQLNVYLGSIAAQRNKRIFGAIAVGKVVRFYEWDWESSQVENVAQNDAYFYIDRQCQTVTGWLAFFRDNHL
jgi:hypothetical protein